VDDEDTVHEKLCRIGVSVLKELVLGLSTDSAVFIQGKGCFDNLDELVHGRKSVKLIHVGGI